MNKFKMLKLVWRLMNGRVGWIWRWWQILIWKL